MYDFALGRDEGLERPCSYASIMQAQNTKCLRRNVKVHTLKTDPHPFQLVWDKKKRFEIRLDDRGYETGDVLILRGTQYSGDDMSNGAPLVHTGLAIVAEVTCAIRGQYGLSDGWVVMGIR